MGGALKIAKDAFNERKVRFTRVMHMEMDLLNNISNVWASESSVLEGTREATMERGIRNQRTGRGR